MRLLRFTLVADGSSDRALIPILEWVLGQCLPNPRHSMLGQLAEFQGLVPAPRRLEERVDAALIRYPCDLIFVHRDSERGSFEERAREVERCLQSSSPAVPHVPVIPVRMTEAWLLVDEAAIRRAAGNPNGQVPLGLPAASRIETLPDPKQTLEKALEVASEKAGRRLKMFRRDLPHSRHLVARFLRDFELLRALSAFRELEKRTRQALVTLGIADGPPGSPGGGVSW